MPVATLGRRQARHCGWCGRRLPEDDKPSKPSKPNKTDKTDKAGRTGKVGRPRRYCGQACRQRAYERRSAVQRGGLPDDAVVLSNAELADLQDRLFQLRCAAEDVATAADDGADQAELRTLARQLADAALGLERLR